MVQKVLIFFRKQFRGLANFVRLLRGLPPDRGGVSKVGAKQARQAMHIWGAGGVTNVTGTTHSDSYLGKAIASGHKKKVYGDPASKNQIVGYGGHPPKHRRKTSGLVTLILVLVFLAIVVLVLF